MMRVSEPSETQPRNLEEYVAQDLDNFWKWCPTPADGLHRCCLLVKLFDYCGLTRKEDKLTDQVRRLNLELFALGVFTTHRIEPHQRVSYGAFAQSQRLRDAVSSCPDSQIIWKCERMGRSLSIGGGKTPLALWVLRVITPEAFGLDENKPAVLDDEGNMIPCPEPSVGKSPRQWRTLNQPCTSCTSQDGYGAEDKVQQPEQHRLPTSAARTALAAGAGRG